MHTLRSPRMRPKCQSLTIKPFTKRPFSACTAAMVQAEDLHISAGHDAESVARDTTALVDNGKWKLWSDNAGLERRFKFKTFKATWDFMNAVAAECKRHKHHPEWTNVYNQTHIRWTTHKPQGLSGKDTAMAHFCDEAAREFGEVEIEGDDATAEGAKIDGGECCSGKSM